MNLFYGLLALGMAAYNLIRGLQPLDWGNLLMAALWLVIGVGYTLRHRKEKKMAMEKQQRRKEEA